MIAFLQKIFLSICFLSGSIAGAQVKFTASISPGKIGKDEYTQLKLLVENASEVQQIVPPSLNDFNIVSGPNQETGMTMNNGIVKKFVALTFILKPKTTGRFTILPAKARADAGDYTSNPVFIKVVAQATGNSVQVNPSNALFGAIDPFAEPTQRSNFNDYILRKDERAADKVVKNLFVSIEVDKKSVFVGEPIVATYKLYTRLKSESNMIKTPSFNGFSVVEMAESGDENYRKEKFKGRDYNVYHIRKVQLYPLLAGSLELGAAEIENKVQFIKADYVNTQMNNLQDVYNDFADQPISPEAIEIHNITLSTKPLTIEVKSLPTTSKPLGYKGAVGIFSINMKLEKKEITTDDDVKLAVIVSGEGNLQMINAPDISWPSGIVGFEPVVTDDLFKGTVPVSGRKIFEFPFTCSTPGKYLIPPVALSFFNTKTAKYTTIHTTPVEISISKGTGKLIQVVADSPKKAGGNILARFFHNRIRVVSLIAILIMIGLILWLKQDMKKEVKSEVKPVFVDSGTEDMGSKKQEFEQESPLGLSAKLLHSSEPGIFYKQINQEFKTFLSLKLSLPAEAMNKKQLLVQLDKLGVSYETVQSILQLIDEIEWELYTPEADENNKQALYSKAIELVYLLNTYSGQV